MTKNIIRTILLVFVAVSAAYMLFSLSGRDGGSPPAEVRGDGEAGSGEMTVRAYYFFGNKRCNTCRNIERFTREALESGFPAELESGLLTMDFINVDRPENEHYIRDFQLTVKSVVIVLEKEGKQVDWKNLGRIWELAGDRGGFIDYIQSEARVYIEVAG